MMKKSEVIRAAVDQYLSPVYGQDVYQLCVCLKRLATVNPGLLSFDMLEELQQDIRYQLGSRVAWTPYWKLVQAADPEIFHMTQELLDDLQQVRFMFAEFLALMYEDEEALEEAEKEALDRQLEIQMLSH